jgi:hypothetical protein
MTYSQAFRHTATPPRRCVATNATTHLNCQEGLRHQCQSTLWSLNHRLRLGFPSPRLSLSATEPKLHSAVGPPCMSHFLALLSALLVRLQTSVWVRRGTAGLHTAETSLGGKSGRSAVASNSAKCMERYMVATDILPRPYASPMEGPRLHLEDLTGSRDDAVAWPSSAVFAITCLILWDHRRTFY